MKLEGETDDARCDIAHGWRIKVKEENHSSFYVRVYQVGSHAVDCPLWEQARSACFHTDCPPCDALVLADCLGREPADLLPVFVPGLGD